MARVLITPRSLTSDPPPALGRLNAAGHDVIFCTPGKTPDESELLSLLTDVEGWLAGVEPVSPSVIAGAPRLRVISRNGTGVDNLPIPEIEARGIHVARALAANATGVAELALGLIVAACRHLPGVAHGVRTGAWPRVKGREIEGAVVGIVGFGAIGRKLARVLDALGAKVIAHDPFRPPLCDMSGRVTYVELDELLARAEIVTLHCPMPADGSRLIRAETLQGMRRGAILVNTARSGLIDERAVQAALDDGRLDTYATDVFETEPPAPGSLASHPGVIATSHIGGLTTQSVTRATDMAVDNLIKHLAGPGDAAG